MSRPPPQTFDRNALDMARARAERIGSDRFLLREAFDGVASRILPFNSVRQHGLVIEPQGLAVSAYSQLAETWTIARLSRTETLDVQENTFDLAISVLGLHSVNDLPGVLVQIRRALKPDGLFVAALFAGATLNEMRNSLAAAEIEVSGGVSPRVFPFADVRDLGNLLQRTGFALPVADLERTTVLYGDLYRLARDLRAHGESNSLATRKLVPSRRKLFQNAMAHYRQYHSDSDGRLRATFEIVYLVGFAPAPGQPKPLRPGSATMRLAHALREPPPGEGPQKSSSNHQTNGATMDSKKDFTVPPI